MQHFDIKLGEYLSKRLDTTTLKLIGEGGFKFVFEVEDNELGKKVALYTLKDISQIKQSYKGYDELKMLMQIDHPNLIELLYVQPKNVTGVEIFLTELLSESLQDRRSRALIPSEVTSMEWMKQVLLGLNHMHEKKLMIHQDIKLENIFHNVLTGEVKIGDFGFAIPLKNVYDV